MWMMFLDEFGDFSAKFDQGIQRTDYDSWRPVCGYGGFLIPASRYLEFCDHFSRLRLIGTRNIAFARHTATTVGDRRASYEEFQKKFDTQRHRLYSKTEEVKGSEFFSGSYLGSAKVRTEKKNAVYRRAKNFLALIDACGGEVFYSGVDKIGYFSKLRNRARTRSLHKNLLPYVLKSSHEAAVNRNEQVTLIFDHHGEDNDTKARIEARQRKIAVHSQAILQTRQEYSQEVIIQEGLYDYLKEPIFHIESHWSLGVQAADWVCSIIGKLKSYEIDQNSCAKYQAFYEKLSPKVEEISCKFSEIHFRVKSAAPPPRQFRLNF